MADNAGMGEPEPDDPENPRTRRRAVIGLLLILVLVVGGLFLAQVLREASRVQDCVMSGRTNCAPIDSSQLPGN